MIDLLQKVDSLNEEILSIHIAPESFDFHAHRLHQLTYIIGGTTYLETRQYSYLVPARHFVWIPANYEHKFTHKSKSPTSVYSLYVPIHDEMTQLFFEEIGLYPAPVLLIEILKMISNQIMGKNTIPYNFVLNYLLLLPQSISNKLKIALPISSNNKMNDITHFINQNLDKELTLDSIANKFNMSTRTLIRQFKIHMQISCLQYIKQARMVKAIELLLDDDLNVNEIAYHVGYKSISAFSNAFKEIMHTRPTDFAKMNSGNIT